MPSDVTALQRAYVSHAPLTLQSGNIVSEQKVEAFTVPALLHQWSVDRWETFCLTLLADLQGRQPRQSDVKLSMFVQSAMRQQLTWEEAWSLPTPFRRLDIQLGKDLVESVKADALFSMPRCSA